MVRNYAALSENTLVAVATKGSQEHLQSIVSRAVVSPAVSDIVVERGDQKTVRKARRATKAHKFSSGGMRKLAHKSENRY